MSREYVFSHYCSFVDICKDEYEPVFDSNGKSFLWDKNLKGITLKQDVGSNNDVNVEKNVGIRLIIIKDKDCKDFKKVELRYNQWKYLEGKVSSAIKVDSAIYQKVLELYSEELKKSTEEIFKHIVYKQDMDYSMPIGQYDDCLTLTISIDNDMLEANTRYRIGVVQGDEDFLNFCDEWAWFELFRPTMPLEEMFVPCSAYLKVRKSIQGKLSFDEATNYRHYSDFYSDIHFDPICMEVEVNPTLVCFELEVKCDKDSLPTFSMILSAEGEVVHRDSCRYFDMEGTGRIVVCSRLSTDNFHITSSKELTASLQVVDHTIASFSFLTNKKETGEFKFEV